MENDTQTTPADEPQGAASEDPIDKLIAEDEAADAAQGLKSEDAGTQAPAGDDTGATTGSGTRASAKEHESQETQGQQAQQKTPESKDAEAGQKPPENETAYQKAQREHKEREARTWGKINKRKEEQDAREAQLQERERQADIREARGQQQPQGETQQHTADEYKAAAKQWDAEADQLERDGKFQEADKKRALAEQAREVAETAPTDRPAQQTTQQAAQADPLANPANQAQFRVAQRQAWDKAKSEIPELADKDSPVAKRTAELLKGEMHEAFQLPGGPAVVARLAKAEHEAARVPDLVTENEKLNKRVEELEAATTPGGGGGSPPGSLPETPFEELSLAEQEKQLRQELAG